ncbi:MAG: hypothetical protein ACREVX_00825 [Clostridium sp.]
MEKIKQKNLAAAMEEGTTKYIEVYILWFFRREAQVSSHLYNIQHSVY